MRAWDWLCFFLRENTVGEAPTAKLGPAMLRVETTKEDLCIRLVYSLYESDPYLLQDFLNCLHWSVDI
jgi:hypothetical protein